MTTHSPLKLTLVISSLASGGAERVMSTIANYWAGKGWVVTLITLDSLASDFYNLHPRVNRIALDLMVESIYTLQAIKNNLIRIFRLRIAIKLSKPDVVISFVEITNILTLLATYGSAFKVVVSERIDPEYYEIGRLWRVLRRATYPCSSIIVVQSQQVKLWIARYITNTKIAVIPNPINHEPIDKNPVSLAEYIGPNEIKNTIIAMGRLSFQKGFDMLIRAFAKIASCSPGWRLIIFGEGEDRDALESLVREFNLFGRVFLPGRVNNSRQILAQADLFVLSSRYEGFPNVLLEAMACGLPVVSFDCPSGPREIIRHGVDGMLVPPENVKTLSAVMKYLMSDGSARKRLADRGPEVLERFGLEKTMAMWEEVLHDVLEKVKG